MPGVGIKIDIRGAKRVANLMRRVRGLVEDNRQELHLRWGIRTLNWVTRNFAAEGALTGSPWKKLSPNTIAGRRKGSSRILQDTAGSGGLKGSFTINATSSEVAVGTEKEYALYHEKGTKGPYPIAPRNKDYLAFPRVGGTPLRKAAYLPSQERTYPKGTPFVFTKNTIMHPGLPVRRMLPKRTEILPDILRTTINYLEEIKKR